MASNKIERINEDIKYTLSVLLRNVKDPRVNQGMISVTDVKATGDLKFCKVYVSVMGLTNEKELMKGLRSASGYLRHELGSRLSIRNTPELIFEVDHSIEYGTHISKLINSLNISHESEDGSDGADD